MRMCFLFTVGSIKLFCDGLFCIDYTPIDSYCVNGEMYKCRNKIKSIFLELHFLSYLLELQFHRVAIHMS